MTADHWNRLFQAWSKVPGPRRVPDVVLACIDELIAAVPGRTLMLGVTQGLAEVGSDLTAIDRSETLVRSHWQGNIPSRRALVGDWFAPPFAPGTFATCVGDGMLTPLEYPAQIIGLLRSVSRVLRPGGLFVCRVFTAPDRGEAISDVMCAALRKDIDRFQSLKFRIGMALAAAQDNPNIPVDAIFRAFEERAPDRDRFAVTTGWPRKEIDTIDVYAGSSMTYSFPTRRQYIETVPSEFTNARLVNVPNYELAERYPLLVAERR